MPLSGDTLIREKRQAADGTVYEVTWDADGAPVDGPAMLAEEQATLLAVNGRATPALVAHLDELEGDAPVDVVLWSSEALPVVEKAQKAPFVESFEEVVLDLAVDAANATVKGELTAYAVDSVPLGKVAAVRATLPAWLAAKLALSPNVGRIGLAPIQLIPTAATAADTTGAREVHIWGYDGAGQVIATGGLGGPDSTGCLSAAMVRGAAAETSEEATVAAGLARSDDTPSCTPGLLGGVAPGAALRVTDATEVAGCDGVCWALSQGATVVAVGWAAASSLQSEASVNEYDAYLDSLVKLPPYPLIVASAGNSNAGDGTPCTTGSGAGYVQNHLFSGLVVGGIADHGSLDRTDDTLYECSSWKNPTSIHGDRELPELMAPAVGIEAAGAGPADGTSLAAAVVGGVAALVLERNTALSPWPEALRAILLTAAAGDVDGNTAFSCPDETSGCGKDGLGTVVATRAVQLADAGGKVSGLPGEGPRDRGFDYGTMVFATSFPDGYYHVGGLPVRYQVTVPPGGSSRVVLAWDSTGVPGASYTDTPDADLDLYVYDSAGAIVSGSYSWDNTVEAATITNAGQTSATYQVVIRLWSHTSATTYFGLAFTNGDATPPSLWLKTPVNTRTTQSEPVRVAADGAGMVTVRGHVEDLSSLAYATVILEGMMTELSGAGDFEVSVPLGTVSGMVDSTLDLALVAEDIWGNRAVLAVPLLIRSNDEQNPEVIVGVEPAMPERDIDDLVALTGGTLSGVDTTSSTVRIAVPPSLDPVAAAATLRASEGVLFATPGGKAKDDELPAACDLPAAGFPGDPKYGKNTATWHLNQLANEHHWFQFGYLSQASNCSYAAIPKCALGATCNASKGFCECTSDAQCPMGTFCATGAGWYGTPPATCYVGASNAGLCLNCSYAGSDIHWEAVKPEMCAVQVEDREVRAAVVEGSGLFAWKHPDLKSRVWTDPVECCGSSSGPCPDADGDGLPDCVAGESLVDYTVGDPSCFTTAHNCGNCESAPKHLHIPLVGKCAEVRGVCLNGTCLYGKVGDPCADDDECKPPLGALCCAPRMTNCTGLSDCGFETGKCGKTSHSSDASVCMSGPNQGLPCHTDLECGLTAGYCASFGPLDICTDGIPGLPGVDDDGDGYTDLDDPEVQRLLYEPKYGLMVNGIDDDFDGFVDNASEAWLAALDDDEDGYIDDIHGVDLVMTYDDKYNKAKFGPPFATTHDAHVARHGASHPTKVAGLLAAQVDNGLDTTGVSPTAQLVAIGTDDPMLERALAYAALVRARIVNMSWHVTKAAPQSCDTACQANHLAMLRDLDKRFHAMADPNTLYVLSAGNERVDLDAAPNPVTGTWGTEPASFPQSVRPKRTLVTGASGFRDEFVDWKWGCTAAYLTDPTNQIVCGVTAADPDPEAGSNRGATMVDLAAPGVDIWSLDYTATWQLPFFSRSRFGTSFSAPIAAGAGAFLWAFDPGRYANRPLSIIDRLRQTVTTVPGATASSYVGRTAAHGRIDLGNAVDETTYPVPSGPPYINVTWQIPEVGATETHGVALFRVGGTDVLFRVYGGKGATGMEVKQPTLFVTDGAGRFHQEPWRLPNIPGDYSTVATGDLNNDGCTDLVLGGHLESDLSLNPPQSKPFKGRRDVVLLQDATGGGSCLASFVSTSPIYLGGGDITRDVAIGDVNQDGNLDVVTPEVNYNPGGVYWPGGRHRTRLYLGNGAGGFTEASTLIAVDYEMDGHAVEPCDVDGDGDLDLVVAGRRRIGLVPASRRPRILINTMTHGNPATLAFTEADPVTWGLPEVYRIHGVTCADVDGDGWNDLLLARQQNAKNILLHNTGAGSFVDASAQLPDLASGADGFDYLNEVEWTQQVAVCQLEDITATTLFYANGDISNSKFESNAVMRAGGGGSYVAAHQALGFEFDRTLDLTEQILCADLDGNGKADAVFIANTAGRDVLYRYRGSL